MLPRGLRPTPHPAVTPALSPLRGSWDNGTPRLLLHERERLPVASPVSEQAGEGKTGWVGGPYRGPADMGLGRDAMAPGHAQNPSWCGVCSKFVAGLTQHQATRTHLAAFQPILLRLAAIKAAANISVPKEFPGLSIEPAKNDHLRAVVDVRK